MGRGHEVTLNTSYLYSSISWVVTKAKSGIGYHVAILINNIGVHMCNMWQVNMTYRHNKFMFNYSIIYFARKFLNPFVIYLTINYCVVNIHSLKHINNMFLMVSLSKHIDMRWKVNGSILTIVLSVIYIISHDMHHNHPIKYLK